MKKTDLYLQPTQGIPAWLGRFGIKFILGALSMREQSLPFDKDYKDRKYFDRSRYIYPQIDTDIWQLKLLGTETSLSLSLKELLALPTTTNLSVQECAGNGNHIMGSAGLMGQAIWSGPLLKDVLSLTGDVDQAKHLVFRGHDGLKLLKKGYHFGLSVAECIRAGALIATHMNGEPLSRERGAPARLIVPGIYSMCHVKWLKSIELLDEPHKGVHNTLIYVNKERQNGKWVKVQPRQIGLKSLIHRCQANHDGWELSGVAWGGDCDIVGVEVSTDGGESWHAAETQNDRVQHPNLKPEDCIHQWKEFSYQWRAKSGRYLVGSRAINSNGEVQMLALPAHIKGHYDQCQIKWRRVVVPPPEPAQIEKETATH